MAVYPTDMAQSEIRQLMEIPTNNKRSILHICTRETIRPLRDQVLTHSGFNVDSTLKHTEALSMFWARQYDLVLIDVEGETGIPQAEHLCSEIKTTQPGQLVAFVCNWRVAIMTDCPDEILRTEFDPAAFAKGVRDIIPPDADSALN
jgi:CheY-like chemotaxis protein